MKILESTPSRYDRGIAILTLGKIGVAYDRLAANVETGQNVLDIGCGTGALTLRIAQKGAKVKGIDINSQMLEIARQRAAQAGLSQYIELCEMGIAELASESSEIYDAVASGLCFSELSEDELDYTIKEVRRILKPGGLLLIADEAKPMNIAKRILNELLRLPLKAITYLVTQTGTQAIENLTQMVGQSGFDVTRVRINKMENFIELVAVKRSGELE